MLTKTQIINNLIKYKVIPENQFNRYYKCSRREKLIDLMNKSLPQNIIKEIYYTESAKEFVKKEDYTPLVDFVNNEVKNKGPIVVLPENRHLQENKSKSAKKHIETDVKKHYNNSKITQEMVNQVIQKIEEFY